MSEKRRVLLVIGDEQLAEFVQQALAHPSIDLDRKGEDFVAALKEQRYDLALVGGIVGTRGPLVLCEAIRGDQRIPTVVLLGPNIKERALAQHRQVSAEEVRYFDPSGWRDPRGDVGATGLALRHLGLELMALEDDDAAAEEWRESLDALTALRKMNQRRQEKAAREREDREAREAAQSSPPAIRIAAESSETQEAPPFRAQLTDEDLDFAQKTIERLRSVDFRKPLSASQAKVDSADVRLVQLRSRVRELERQLARLAFVYRARAERFDHADETTAALSDARQDAEAKLARLEAEYEQKLRAAKEAADAREKRFNAVLEEVRQAFDELKGQSKNVVERLEAEVDSKGDALAGHEAEERRLREQLSRALEAQAEATRRHDEIVEDAIQREHSAAEQVARASAELNAEKAAWLAERDTLRDEVDALERELEKAMGARSEALEDLEAAERRLQDEQRRHDAELERRDSEQQVIERSVSELKDHQASLLEDVLARVTQLGSLPERLSALDDLKHRLDPLDQIQRGVAASTDRLSGLEVRMTRLDEVADRASQLDGLGNHLEQLLERVVGLEVLIQRVDTLETTLGDELGRRLATLDGVEERLKVEIAAGRSAVAEREARLDEKLGAQHAALGERLEHAITTRFDEKLAPLSGIEDRVDEKIGGRLALIDGLETRLADAIGERLQPLSGIEDRVDEKIGGRLASIDGLETRLADAIGERLQPLSGIEDRVDEKIGGRLASIDGLETQLTDAIGERLEPLSGIESRIDETLRRRLDVLDGVDDRLRGVLGDAVAPLQDIDARLRQEVSQQLAPLDDLEHRLEQRLAARLEALDALESRLEERVGAQVEPLRDLDDRLEHRVRDQLAPIAGLEGRLGDRLREGLSPVEGFEARVAERLESGLGPLERVEQRLARIEELETLDSHMERLGELSTRLEALGPLDELLALIEDRNKELMRSKELSSRFAQMEHHLGKQDATLEKLAEEQREARLNRPPWVSATPLRFTVTAVAIAVIAFLAGALLSGRSAQPTAPGAEVADVGRPAETATSAEARTASKPPPEARAEGEPVERSKRATPDANETANGAASGASEDEASAPQPGAKKRSAKKTKTR